MTVATTAAAIASAATATASATDTNGGVGRKLLTEDRLPKKAAQTNSRRLMTKKQLNG